MAIVEPAVGLKAVFGLGAGLSSSFYKPVSSGAR